MRTDYAELARSKADEESNPERRNELTEIAGICERVPEHPARTFHEALQCMNFIMWEEAGDDVSSPGRRIDQYLKTYFEKDILEAG